ncbi:MAG: guanylate kinase [Chitinophagales bacterium]|nr:guanylate kinase [Chitinophagales bacterium]
MSENSSSKHQVIIFTGPSGGGKTTLMKYTLQHFEQIERAVSATSRLARKNEIEGIDYYFFPVEKFKDFIEKDDFIEWQQVYEDLYYGTLKSELDRLWRENKIVLFVVDVVGAVNLKKYFGDNALMVFVKAPSLQILESRLLARGTETLENIYRRLDKARIELEYEQYADVVIINDNLDDAKYDISEFIRAFLY